MRFIRPASPADLEALMELAGLSGPGFTSLPVDESTLADRLKLSAASFSGEVAPSEAWYTLMIEDAATGRVDGLSGVRAAVGLKRPHFSFRVVTLAQYSPAIDTRFDHRALVLVNECGGWTEVGSLFLRPDARSGGAGTLLARSRYLLIGADPARFATTVMAELRGWVGQDGASPFWDGIASKFFRLPFVEADSMVMSTDGQFILDLAPRHPIYLDLISADARDAVGRCHHEGEAALAMLEKEGFAPCGLVDIFDGGPTVTCPRARISTIAETRRLPAQIDMCADAGKDSLVSTTDIPGFRALHTRALIEDETAFLNEEAAALLGVRAGDIIQIRP